MKSYHRVTRRCRRLAISARRFARYRRGTVIIVVLALLGMLAFIGVFALSLSTSENQGATYFAQSSKVAAVDYPDANAFFNNVLRQIIIGPAFSERQSALWSGKHSLLPTMFGRDLAPYNGQGINLTWNGTTKYPAVDQNYNGLPDDGTADPINNSRLLQINFSPAAQGVLLSGSNAILDFNTFLPPVPPSTNPTPCPEPDANWTYPDINSVFLSYDALVPNGTSGATNPLRMIIPSFHRPWLLRNAAANAGGNVTPAQWYTDKNTAALVFHPHREHVAIDTNGNVTTTQRFVSTAYPDTGSPALQPFPFPGEAGGPTTVSGRPSEGIWSNGTTPGDPIDYGVDVDADGVPDAFYIDFGFPLITSPDGSQQYVPLAAVKIIDADSLFNLNVHGNGLGTAMFPGNAGNIPFGGAAQMICRSDQGVSGSEVNLEWALNARPVAASPDFGGNAAALQAALSQHTLFFRTPDQSTVLPTDDHSTNSFELANMESWNLLRGRPQLTPSATPTTTPPTVSGTSYPGRWGETARLDAAVQAVLAATAIQAGVASTSVDPFPLPGTSGFDDNFNAPEGGTYTDEQNLTHLSFVQPIDYFAAGTWVTGTQGKTRALLAPGSQKFPQYGQFATNSTIPWTSAFGGALMPNFVARQLIDEPDETVTEPGEAAKQPNDNIFAPSENLIQLSGTDFTSLGNSARTASLMPFNFVSSARAAEIRKRFTSTSWDLKSFGKEFLGVYTGTDDARRLWEFTDNSTAHNGLGPFLFPPTFPNSVPFTTAAQLQPFRPDLANLLQIVMPTLLATGQPADPSAQPAGVLNNRAQRFMSINHLTEQTTLTDPATNTPYTSFRFRPLTPHPTTGLTRAAIGTFPITRPEQLATGNLQQQEWLARYDRQRLARDIYVLLYTFGGGSDALNYTQSNAARNLYSDDQLQEMAQFAVNWVDALDPDDHITLFEYDKNLADGWNLDDNPYDSQADQAAPYNIPLIDRGVVYGVERQTLAFNEALVIYAQRATDSSGNPSGDHRDTQYNDTKPRTFFYAELENVGAAPVSFVNQGWQIAVKQSPTVTTPSTYYGNERRLILTSSQPDVQPGTNGRITIGGTGDADNLDPSTGVVRPSWFVVDPNDGDLTHASDGWDNHSTLPPGPGFPIAPRGAFTGPTPSGNTAALDLDLIQPGQINRYFVVPPGASASPPPGLPVTAGDGQALANSPVAAGSQLLQFVDPTFSIGSATSITLRIELRRRADLSRQPPIIPTSAGTEAQNLLEAQDNPWIVVDYMDIPVSMFILHAGDNYVQVRQQLTSSAHPVVSTERSQPLYHDNALAPNGGVTTKIDPTWIGNSLGQNNDAPNAVIPHTLWQPHYDRDFTSIAELFNIPLYGPYSYQSRQSPAGTPVPSPQSLQDAANIGLTYRMGARRNESGGPLSPESLVGDDWDPVAYSIQANIAARYLGFGTAGYRFQHPEGADVTQPNPATDVTENRWFRILGLFEVPTRSHRELENPAYQITAGSTGGPFGFYRTPGKVNLNTLRYPEIVAGLLGETGLFSLQYTPAAVPMYVPVPPATTSPTLSVPYLLPDSTGDTVAVAPQSPPQSAPAAPAAGSPVRDWWVQFITARDGTDPLPIANGGTADPTAPTPALGLSLPGIPRSVSFPAPGVGSVNPPTGSHPFRGLGFSAYGGVDAGGYNEPLDSTILRGLPGDQVTATPDPRRRLFELGTQGEHVASALDYATKHRLLSRLIGNTTTRSNVFFVWIQVDFFQAKDVNPPNGVVRIGSKLGTNGVQGTSPGYRGFFVIDRSHALPLVTQQHLPATDPTTGKFIYSFNQSFNWQSLVLHSQKIQ